MQIHPVGLQTKNDALEIIWSDQSIQVIGLKALRAACPCAHCLSQKMGEAESAAAESSATANPLNILSPADVQPLSIVSMQPVGNYAYSIRFSDGHASGIYTFSLLHSLA